MLEKIHKIKCDHCLVREELSPPGMRADEFRKELKGAGWKSRGTLDFCPECKAKGIASKKIMEYRKKHEC